MFVFCKVNTEDNDKTIDKAWPNLEVYNQIIKIHQQFETTVLTYLICKIKKKKDKAEFIQKR